MSLDRLLRGEVARDVLWAYRRYVASLARQGREVPEHAADVLEGLDAAAQRRHLEMSDTGHGLGSVVDIPGSWGSVREGADSVGISERHARRLAEGGQVRSRLVGKRWLIDLDSLRSVIASRRSR